MDSSQINRYFDLLKQKDLFAANEYRHSLVPKVLYKYCPLFDDEITSENRLKSLRENKLWLSTYASLNDPMDLSSFYLDREKFSYFTSSQKVIDDAEKFMQNYVRDNVTICSLTTNSWESMLMWAHYANNHQGYCVEYEITNPQYIWDVIYQENRTSLANSIVYQVYEAMHGRPYNMYTGLLLQQNFIKSKEWQYEHEYRVLQTKENLPDISEKGCLVDLEPYGLKVSKIVMGWKCAYEKQLSEIAKKLNCPIIKVAPSKTEFKMEESIWNT